MLKTETNTPAVEKKVLTAARKYLKTRKVDAVFEHGQWWVFDLRNDDIYSVNDAETITGEFYFSFDEI